jgi:carbon-monoxide dehydrogenase small subunit
MQKTAIEETVERDSARQKRQFTTIRCTINGMETEVAVDVRASLADMLRKDFGLTSVKKGCEVGECGACNVIIDGECFNSCIYMAIWADGKNIRTVESLAGTDGELSEIQRLFVEEGAIQCGFCTPGFLMTATAILESGRDYTREELKKELSGHLCRCTGYENILNAVEKAVRRISE